MLRLPVLAIMCAASGAFRVGAQSPPVPPVPWAITNNAVAAGVIGGSWRLFSLLGIDSTRTWSGISRQAFGYDDATRRWSELPPVPGPHGRLAATAQVVRETVYLFGGYTVDANGTEHSLDVVDIFDPAHGSWKRGAPIPTSVDDAVSGVYRDSLIYLISGWHENDNTQLVQIYDVVRNRWTAGTPIPGPGVFGHAGAISGNSIVYIDGVTKNDAPPKYRVAHQSWLGTIDLANPSHITWRPAATHPDPGRYRAAAGVCGPLVAFAGGTSNPYNYNGIGYDGHPSAPLAGVVAYDTRTGAWKALPSAPTATMDHRALAMNGHTAIIVGGMHQSQHVANNVVQWSLGSCN